MTTSEFDQLRLDVVRWAAQARSAEARIAAAVRLVADFGDQDPPEDLKSELAASEQLCADLREALTGEAT